MIVVFVALEVTRSWAALDTFKNGHDGGWRWRGFGDATTTVEIYKVGIAGC